MKQVATFYKVSLEQFILDYKKLYPMANEEDIKIKYENIKLPTRATSGSAGYDFILYEDLTILNHSSIEILTGIRVKIEKGYALFIYPRSSLGFKYQLRLANTVGIIDSDYYNALNEGHIHIKLVNDSIYNDDVKLKANNGYVQGIFMAYNLTSDDECEKLRVGGIGSTSK